MWLELEKEKAQVSFFERIQTDDNSSAACSKIYLWIKMNKCVFKERTLRSEYLTQKLSSVDDAICLVRQKTLKMRHTYSGRL